MPSRSTVPVPARVAFFLFAALLALPSAAQPSPRPSLTAAPVEAGAVRLDGVLDEAAWASAAPAGGFVQYIPVPGVPPSEPTEARVLIGPSALYVGMRMADRQPEAIDARLARRDGGADTDYAVVVIDSYADGRTGFLFRVSPGGLKADVLFYDDTEADGAWDAVWDAAVTQDADGWTAEFEIPLSQLRYDGGAGPHRWGLQLVRLHFRTGEVSYWSPRRPEAAGYVSQFGTLTIPGALPAPRRFEAVPYAALATTRAPGDAADPFYDATALAPRAGLDLKLGLTSRLTLAATANPDFGQVEADPAQVNLGGFELFFQERRPFFLEGLDAFSTAPRRGVVARQRPDLLYTRRIGRAPQRTSFVPAAVEDAVGDGGAIYTDAPQQSTILGAAKLSGQVGRFSVGLLNATTRAEYGRFRAVSSGGTLVAEGRALVEPLSNYLVARARGTFGRTIVGGLATSTVRDTGDPAIAGALPTTTTVAGLDAEHALGEEWLLTAQAAGSLLAGSEPALAQAQTAFPRLYQRPDAGHLALDSARTRLGGWTAEANLIKTDGARWTGALHAAATSPGFDANALGFQARADFASIDGLLRYGQNRPQGLFNAWSAEVRGGVGFNFGGDLVAPLLAGAVGGQLRNFWDVDLTAAYTPRFDDDRLTRGGPLAAGASSLDLAASVSTDARRPVTVSLEASGSVAELGGRAAGGRAEVAARPRPALSLSLAPEVELRRDPRQYVTAFDDAAAAAPFGRRTVFGQLDAATVSLAARLDWTFTPDLSLQLYARPFATRGRYAAFKELDRPGALRLPIYGADLGTATENPDGSTTLTPGDGGRPFTVAPDFTVRSLQANAVLRWEYRPGSALFLVWQQRRAGSALDGRLRFGRDLRGLFADAPANVFLVKLTYWLG